MGDSRVVAADDRLAILPRQNVRHARLPGAPGQGGSQRAVHNAQFTGVAASSSVSTCGAMPTR
jgi:hypothetical protein